MVSPGNVKVTRCAYKLWAENMYMTLDQIVGGKGLSLNSADRDLSGLTRSANAALTSLLAKKKTAIGPVQ